MKKELINKAKKLYVSIDETGARSNTLEEIAKILQNQGYKIDLSTISRWANKYNWESSLNDLRYEQVKKIESKITFDTNQIKEELYDVYKVSRLMLIQVANKLIEKLNEKKGNKEEITFKELLIANRVFSDTMNKTLSTAVGNKLYIDHTSNGNELPQQTMFDLNKLPDELIRNIVDNLNAKRAE